jgi:hypothetical protein
MTLSSIPMPRRPRYVHAAYCTASGPSRSECQNFGSCGASYPAASGYAMIVGPADGGPAISVHSDETRTVTPIDALALAAVIVTAVRDLNPDGIDSTALTAALGVLRAVAGGSVHAGGDL